jgi:hypothetical protein
MSFSLFIPQVEHQTGTRSEGEAIEQRELFAVHHIGDHYFAAGGADGERLQGIRIIAHHWVIQSAEPRLDGAVEFKV